MSSASALVSRPAAAAPLRASVARRARRAATSARAAAVDPDAANASDRSGVSYYKVIDGARYDRRVLDDCAAFENVNGSVDLGEARRMYDDVSDGPSKPQGRGRTSSVTDVELATLEYALARYAWTDDARAFVEDKMREEGWSSAVSEKANNAVAAPSSESSSEESSSESSAESLKKRLVALAAASGRGLDATAAQKAAAVSLVADLVAVNPTPDPAMSAKVNGDWELVYSDTFLFRSSPFFWAVGKMMGETGDFFYGAHDHQTGMFGGGVGRVVQSLDLDNNRIVSDCIVKASLGIPLIGFSPVFSGFGSVITAGRAVADSGTRVAVVAETTTIRQDDTEVIPALNFLNNTTVPVEDAMRQLGGGAAPEVFLDIVYVDDDLRVSKLEDGSTFVYQRC